MRQAQRTGLAAAFALNDHGHVLGTINPPAAGSNHGIWRDGVTVPIGSWSAAAALSNAGRCAAQARYCGGRRFHPRKLVPRPSRHANVHRQGTALDLSETGWAVGYAGEGQLIVTIQG